MPEEYESLLADMLELTKEATTAWEIHVSRPLTGDAECIQGVVGRPLPFQGPEGSLPNVADRVFSPGPVKDIPETLLVIPV